MAGKALQNNPQQLNMEELQFTTKKIEDNPSNYSAWHQRSALIPVISGNNEDELKEALNKGI